MCFTQVLSFRNVPSPVSMWHVAALVASWARAPVCWSLCTGLVAPHRALPSYVGSLPDPDTFLLHPGLGTTCWKGSALYHFEKKPTTAPLFVSFHLKNSTAPLLRVHSSIIFVTGGPWDSPVPRQEHLVHHLPSRASLLELKNPPPQQTK